jgi:seryl-tRNA synthetase
VVEDMMEDYGIQHRISSVASLHTNARAELGVKTVKRMLMDIVSAQGIMDRASVEKHSGQRQKAVSSQGSLWERAQRLFA